MTEIYKSPTYVLDLDATKRSSDLVTLNFNVTYPQALRPHTVRKAQFNLPIESVTKLIEALTPLVK